MTRYGEIDYRLIKESIVKKKGSGDKLATFYIIWSVLCLLHTDCTNVQLTVRCNYVLCLGTPLLQLTHARLPVSRSRTVAEIIQEVHTHMDTRAHTLIRNPIQSAFQNTLQGLRFVCQTMTKYPKFGIHTYI